jgi:hypothetical protein
MLLVSTPSRQLAHDGTVRAVAAEVVTISRCKSRARRAGRVNQQQQHEQRHQPMAEGLERHDVQLLLRWNYY